MRHIIVRKPFEKKYTTIEKIYSPNDYINIIKNSNERNPIRIVYLNFPLTDNLQIIIQLQKSMITRSVSKVAR